MSRTIAMPSPPLAPVTITVPLADDMSCSIVELLAGMGDHTNAWMYEVSEVVVPVRCYCNVGSWNAEAWYSPFDYPACTVRQMVNYSNHHTAHWRRQQFGQQTIR